MHFKRLADLETVEIGSYVSEYLRSNPNTVLYVGCDSQNKGEVTNYATTIVMHVGNTGCHVIYNREVVPRINDMWTRLWNEVEKSVAVALYLKEHGIEVDNIDLDLNNDPNEGSHKLVQAATGYVRSLGIAARIKPEVLPACHAADNLANK
jgi:predicted RNase H-related nuclease YkuK (DUF458 family)